MRDYKHYKAQEGAHLTRMATYLVVAVTVALFAWLTERDGHPFHDVKYVQQVEVRS